MKKEVMIALMAATLLPMYASAKGNDHDAHGAVSDKVISEQRAMLSTNTKGKGFGPQSPRDIDARAGNNKRLFNAAPASTDMNLCKSIKVVSLLNMQVMAMVMDFKVVTNTQVN